MFEIYEGLFLDPWAVQAIKAVGEKQCAVFLKGQSAVDGGFLIEKSALDAATDVLEARRDDEETEDDPDDTEDDEEV